MKNHKKDNYSIFLIISPKNAWHAFKGLGTIKREGLSYQVRPLTVQLHGPNDACHGMKSVTRRRHGMDRNGAVGDNESESPWRGRKSHACLWNDTIKR